MDNFVNQSIVHIGDADDATVWVNVSIPLLDEGQHNVTTYFGWQFQGIQENPRLQRYEVMAYSSVSFSVVNSNPFPANLVISASGASAAIVVIGLALHFLRFKKRNGA